MGSRPRMELFGQLETLFRFGAVGTMSDAQLLERFLAGRDEAGEANFRALVARHGPMVLRVCRTILVEPHDAEDAFQVTFLALARKAGSIQKHSSLGSWLHGTARRVARKAKTASRRRLARESRVKEAEMSIESQPSLEDREFSQILHEEIERLPAEYRAAIVLCYLEGMTHGQAALALGWPVGTVRGRLARARNLLKSRLTRRGLAIGIGPVALGSPADAASAELSAALVDATVRVALGRSSVTELTSTAAPLLEAVLSDTALARWTQLAAPVALLALVAGVASNLLFKHGTKVSKEQTAIAKARPVARAAPTDLAGDPLPAGALARLGTTRFVHASHVNHVAFSPDGATLASFDGALYLWDARTGLERRRIETGAGPGSGSLQFAYAPNGQSLAVQAVEVRDGAIPGKGREKLNWTILYDPRTGHEIRRFEGKDTANCFAFSPDGKVLAGGIRSGPRAGITLWEVASGRMLRSMADSCAGTIALAFSPNGKALISCVSWMRDDIPKRNQSGAAARQHLLPEESSIRIWDVADGKEIHRIGIGKIRINRAVFAPDGKTLATGATDKTIRLWDLAAGREIRRFGRGDSKPYGIVFSPDGTKLASTEGPDPEFPNIGESPRLTTPIHVWDTATGEELNHWETDSNSLASFSPDGATLAVVGGHVIRLWDVASGREIRPQMGHRSAVRPAIGDAAFTANGRLIATVGSDRTIRFWDSATGKEVCQLNGNEDGLRFVSLSADGTRLASGGGFQPTRLWDVPSGRELRRFQTPGKIRDSLVECADLSPDGKTLATSVNDGVIFWDTETGEQRAGLAESPIHLMVKALRFAPDGMSVAMISGDWVRLWVASTGRETRRIQLPNKGPNEGFSTNGAKLAFSPDGTVLAASSTRDGLIFLLDVASGRELGRIDGPGSQQKAFAFSPDGNVFASGIDISQGFPNRDLAIGLWDVATQNELARVRAHRGSISALAFSPDGRRLLSASEDATALVWDVAAISGRGKAVPPPALPSKALGHLPTEAMHRVWGVAGARAELAAWKRERSP